tara:strand:+ start:1789 stop:1992 length:204 start_codon:yes stop_codon:yes gene_type:complete
VQFTSEEKAKIYLKKLKYSYRESINYKNEKFKIYGKGRQKLLLTSNFGYLSKNNMDMGVVWNISIWS